MWQEIIVGIMVLGAALYLARQWLPFTKKSPSACGGCGGCDTAKSCSHPQKTKD